MTPFGIWATPVKKIRNGGNYTHVFNGPVYKQMQQNCWLDAAIGLVF